jgi:hypothetical protein
MYIIFCKVAKACAIIVPGPPIVAVVEGLPMLANVMEVVSLVQLENVYPMLGITDTAICPASSH